MLLDGDSLKKRQCKILFQLHKEQLVERLCHYLRKERRRCMKPGSESCRTLFILPYSKQVVPGTFVTFDHILYGPQQGIAASNQSKSQFRVHQIRCVRYAQWPALYTALISNLAHIVLSWPRQEEGLKPLFKLFNLMTTIVEVLQLAYLIADFTVPSGRYIKGATLKFGASLCLSAEPNSSMTYL